MIAQAPSYRHLIHLTDDTGVLEHALGGVPRRRNGYCLDDNARALMIVSRADSALDSVSSLAQTYLAFVADAQAPDGTCHNRLGYNRLWEDEPGTGDCWGRCVWGLGVAATRHPDPALRRDALACFEISAACRSPHPRAMAFAALGAAEVSRALPGNDASTGLLRATAAQAGRPASDEAWPWPEPRLTYANAVLPQAMIAAGWALNDRRLCSDGLLLLEWLLGAETRNGHLSPTPVGGRSAGEASPAFDQQPIEAAALADACALAWDLTGDPHWERGVALAVKWFLGDNDAGVAMYDPSTGGGYDGLTPTGRNINQGAESTLAAISTFQQGCRLTRHKGLS